MSKTGIPYLDEVWNPVTGCSPISEGCAHCYAKAVAETRLRGKAGYDQDEPFKVTVHDDKLAKLPGGKGKRIGVCFMGDLFHDDVSDDVLNEIDYRVWNNDNQWFFLSKRTSRMAAWHGVCYHSPNSFWGATCENQARLDERLPALLKINGNTWLSLEPLLGPIVLPEEALKWLSWVVVGAESGPGRRPCNVGWVESLIRQCVKAEVPVFYKQGPGFENLEHTSRHGDFLKMPFLFGQQWAHYPEAKR